LARSGNGIDIGAVYQLLTEVAETVRGHGARFDRIEERLHAHDSKLDELAVGLSDLRAAVINYHGAVLGHGVMLSELDERVRRIEHHLKLEPADK
jgi:hypothetical protein